MSQHQQYGKLRGVTISYTAAKRKESLRRQLELEGQISDLHCKPECSKHLNKLSYAYSKL